MTDIRKIYFAMCDCPEVQERWQPKVGDMILIKMFDAINAIANEYVAAFWINEPVNRVLYLPDQRALQNWLPATAPEDIYYSKTEELIMSLYGYYVRHIDYCQSFNSMEQLWLVYFMDTVHGLQWKGGKWQKK